MTPQTVVHQAPLSMNSLGKNTGAGCHFLLQGSSQTRDQTQVSCIAGRFFNLWATMVVPHLNLHNIVKQLDISIKKKQILVLAHIRP